MADEACVVAEHTNCNQLRGGTVGPVRCLRSSAPVHTSSASGAKFGVVDRSLTCAFVPKEEGANGLCGRGTLTPMATQQAVRSQVVRKQHESFRSVETAVVGRGIRNQQLQRARCQKLLEGSCPRPGSTTLN